MIEQEEINENAKHDAESGEYERHFQITKGCLVLDIGAHVGHFASLVCNKGGFVIAFEPHPENFKWLNKRIAERDAIAVNKAATNFTGRATLYECPTNSGAHSLFKHGECSDVQHDVGCLDIGRFIKSSGIKPDFIKIDTEGSEFIILESLLRFRLKTHMAIECHSTDLYEMCRELAQSNGMTWLPDTINIGVCYCFPNL